jgi:Cell division protein CrgA
MAKGKSTRHRGTTTGKYMSAEATGRYTKPIPKDRRTSPVWFTVLVIGLLVVGALLLVGNYLSFLPGAVSPWYLAAGLVLILAGFLLATKLK